MSALQGCPFVTGRRCRCGRRVRLQVRFGGRAPLELCRDAGKRMSGSTSWASGYAFVHQESTQGACLTSTTHSSPTNRRGTTGRGRMRCWSPEPRRRSPHGWRVFSADPGNFGGLLVALGSCIDLVNVVVVLLNATRHVGRYLVKADSTAHTPSAVPLVGLALVALGLHILAVPLHLVNVRAWVVTYAWFHVGAIFLFPLLVRAMCCAIWVMLARTRIGNHQAHRSCCRRPR